MEAPADLSPDPTALQHRWFLSSLQGAMKVWMSSLCCGMNGCKMAGAFCS
jgi:hypothetical protein|uniref:Uncharacterized protein n=1 Tax=Zea mays TaxID=4577 RepID=B4FVW8_MAIZE|nr:unknown [Zea mays]ACG29457.1 hypothetical protein [Zea mays]